MQLHTINNYNDERLKILKEYEGNEPYAYADTEGIATIGIGLNLQVHGMLVLQALGFDVTGTQLKGAALEAEQKYIKQFVENINNNKKGKFWWTYPPNNKPKNQTWAALNAVLIARAKDPVYRDQQNFVSAEAYTAFHNTQSFKYRTFDLPSPWRTVSANLFNQVLDGYIEPGTGDTKSGYEKLLDTWLNRTGVGAIQPGLLVHNNQERLALLSLAFNSRVFGKDQTNTPWNDAGLPTLLGPKLTNALKNNNRAEAWYEIRYGSNAAVVHANRRYKEANLFGLYNTDPNNVTEAEAKEIMRMYTRYEVYDKKLSTYEANHTPQPAHSIDEEVQPANDYLVTNFAMGNTIDGWVIVGQGLDSYNYIEKGNWTDNLGGSDSQNDLMFGEKGNDELYGYGGNDVIYGGEGDDILIGGLGNDTLMGGENNDSYIINAGDGEDRVEDTQGDNKIILCGIEISNFYFNGATYISFDGWQTALIYEGHFDVTDVESGTTVRLNENFQWGDFGTTLVTLPADIPALPDPEISNTIVGDLRPVDFDPETEGIQVQYDQWGNVIVDPGQPESGRSDVLYDTTASDKIEGLAGNDTITVSRGSSSGDWVEGGSGDDDIYTSANSLNARIYGGDGDDFIFTDSNGSGWLYGGEGGDIIDGEQLDNCIIEGGADSDIIVGGINGNSQLFGDSCGEMADLIAAGETASDSGVRGDIVAADGENSNFLFGLLRLADPYFSLFHDKKATVVF